MIPSKNWRETQHTRQERALHYAMFSTLFSRAGISPVKCSVVEKECFFLSQKRVPKKRLSECAVHFWICSWSRYIFCIQYNKFQIAGPDFVNKQFVFLTTSAILPPLSFLSPIPYWPRYFPALLSSASKFSIKVSYHDYICGFNKKRVNSSLL